MDQALEGNMLQLKIIGLRLPGMCFDCALYITNMFIPGMCLA